MRGYIACLKSAATGRPMNFRCVTLALCETYSEVRVKYSNTMYTVVLLHILLTTLNSLCSNQIYKNNKQGLAIIIDSHMSQQNVRQFFCVNNYLLLWRWDSLINMKLWTTLTTIRPTCTCTFVKQWTNNNETTRLIVCRGEVSRT